jgi:hypothetical protein
MFMKKIILLNLTAILTASICFCQNQSQISGNQKTNEQNFNTLFTWQPFASSMDLGGNLNPNSRIINYCDEIDVVSFIHQKTCTYSITNIGQNNSGVMVARIIRNWNPLFKNVSCPAAYDSTALASNSMNFPRSPNGGIYNPPGNSHINNAYIVGCGPTTNGIEWSGNWYSSKQLGFANYNNTTPTQPNSQQWFGNPSTGSIQGHNFSNNNFSVTDDGIIRTLAKLGTSYNGTLQPGPGDTSLYIVAGVFGGGTFNWTGTALHPSFEKSSSTNKANFSKAIMAWNEAGTVGYAIAIGQHKNAGNIVNRGMQPMVWKTSNSGASWVAIPNMDFTLPTFSMVINDLASTLNTNTNIAAPYFREVEGMDAVVDKDDRLHFATTIVSHASVHPDSITIVKKHGSDYYYWPHTPGKRPFIYDFTTTGTTWAVRKIDSLSTEAPLSKLEEQDLGTGYDENPWVASGTEKPVSSARIQLGRTVDGKQIYFTWAESDTLITNGNRKWNTFPNVKVRVLDISTNSLSIEMNATSPIGTLGLNSKVRNYAHFHSTSPKTTNILGNFPTNYTMAIPMSVSNNQSLNGFGNCINPSSITHYYNAVTISNSVIGQIMYTCFAPNPCPLAINEINQKHTSIKIFPNPSVGKAQIIFEPTTNGYSAIQITDLTGKIIRILKHLNTEGENSIVINTSDLSQGIYFVNLLFNNQKTTAKLIVE